MVDQGLVHGMMLRQRQQQHCDACHTGKQRRKCHGKKLNRSITAPNEVVYADLMFPSKNNGTRFMAVLSKDATTVNMHMKNYVLWAERQAGRNITKIVQRHFAIADNQTAFPVRKILTDKDTEFVNSEIDE
ncbi:TPA: hypothetical protein N0F65_001961 [Lagenidium giganteum]|uniref:Integrase catalytic domain-containing protein n=1 Tax=Lagenidium giganteum TaxID=4803 RepID=A0AAV2YPS4_9STRA|nr:TPA: hypothetical protein N0F65_001961 [Lagenidium giganteum]